MKQFLPHWSRIVNDIHDVDHETIKHKLAEYTQFSFSFLMLLIASALICTLGLLIDSSAVVIGGMLISPLMWPLIKISLGISLGSKRYLKQAGILLIQAILISLITSFVIAYLSPVKVINAEIITRTQPTLLDLFVALAAGVIATLAVVQKRISDSLAGVAIAVSLLPPLCVGGIGLALGSLTIFSGGLLLFFANGISIIFASLLMFMAVGVRKRATETLRKEGLLLVASALILTAIPLFLLLRDYSFQTTTYAKTEAVLEESFSNLSPLSSIENITIDTAQKDGAEVVTIMADILLPNNVSLTYQDQQTIINRLQAELGKPITLQFRVQQTIALASQNDEYQASIAKTLRTLVEKSLTEKETTLVIHSLSIQGKKNETIEAHLILRGDPKDILSENERRFLERNMEEETATDVQLTVEFIPGYSPLTESEREDEAVVKRVQELINSTYPQAEITDISLTSLPLPQEEGHKLQRRTTVTVSLNVPVTFRATQPQLDLMTASLQQEFGREFFLILQAVERTIYTN